MKNQPQLKLYGLTSYDRSAKVRWTLTELGAEFENQFLNREKKENESPAFLKLNPMGRIPVLEVNNHAFFESGAICMYLGDLFSEKGLAPALTAPERPEYLQWIFFASAMLDTIQT